MIRLIAQLPLAVISPKRVTQFTLEVTRLFASPSLTIIFSYCLLQRNPVLVPIGDHLFHDIWLRLTFFGIRTMQWLGGVNDYL